MDQNYSQDPIRTAFGRFKFPWEAFPSELKDCLLALAKSNASSPHPLPGIVFATLGSLVGALVIVEAKKGWRELLIFWVADVRPSGAGKTPSQYLLTKALPDLADEAEIPQSVNDFDFSGLSRHITSNKTGGVLIEVPELSGLISKLSTTGKSGLRIIPLWQGTDLKSAAGNKDSILKHPCTSILGGIQPFVFKQTFGGKKEIYKEDGTLYRFLINYEEEASFTHTTEDWGQSNKGYWYTLVLNVFKWVEDTISAQEGELKTPIVMPLSNSALQIFVDWQNKMAAHRDELGGFLPKAHSYCLRIAGMLQLIESVGQNQLLPDEIDDRVILNAIQVSEFYLTQVPDIFTLLRDDSPKPQSIGVDDSALAQAIESLRDKASHGPVTYKELLDIYQTLASPAYQVKNTRMLIKHLASHEVPRPEVKVSTEKHKNVYRLFFDEKLDRFVRQYKKEIPENDTDQSPD